MEKLALLLKLIDIEPNDAIAMPSGGGSLYQYKLDIDPYEFLTQAEIDYETGGSSSDLNAITNAKRAIVSQMDQALLSFGYPATKWNIPKKIETLNLLGIVAPRILRKVSKYRNLLEHEYQRPDKEKIEEALDLASLFVACIKPTINVFCDEFVVGNHSKLIDSYSFEKTLSFTMSGTSEKDKATFTAWVEDYSKGERQIVKKESFTYLDDEFASIVKLAIATDKGFKEDEALSEFLSIGGVKRDT